MALGVTLLASVMAIAPVDAADYRAREGTRVYEGRSRAQSTLPYDPYSYSNPLYNNGHYVLGDERHKDEELREFYAAQLPDKQLDYYIVDMRLERFLEELERHAGGIMFTMGRKTDGIIRDVRLSGTIADIMNILAREFSLEWMIEGNELVLASKDTYDTVIIPNRDFSQRKLRETLADMREEDIRRFVRYNPMSGNIEIKGPKEIVARLETRLSDVEARDVKMIKYGQAGGRNNLLE